MRRQIKSTAYGSLLWRVFIGVIGGLITVVGSALLFAPGPGLLVLLAGRRGVEATDQILLVFCVQRYLFWPDNGPFYFQVMRNNNIQGFHGIFSCV